MAEGAAAEPHLDAAARRRILLYAGAIAVAVTSITPVTGIYVIPLSFLLKNRLHLSANALATFTLWVGIPGYLSVLFGLARDFWSPLRLGDRGFFIVFGILGAALYGAFAFVGATVASIFAVMMLSGIAFGFLWAAWNGLASTLGQQNAMSGQMSALWNFAGTSTMVASFFLSGVLSGALENLSTAGEVRVLFLIVAAQMATIAALGFWRPGIALTTGGAADRRDIPADLRRLVRHWPIYPALIIWMLWNFSPGTQTSLQYYLSNTLHASDAQWGAYNAISFGASIPAFIAFGFLSSRFSLRALLWAGALLGATQVLPLLLIHSAQAALIAAVPIGLSGGLATAAYMDLLIRACPKGLEGTMMMMAWSLYAVAVNFGNWWGTDLYDYHGGFVACVIATTAVYLLILPLILAIPRRLIATADVVAQ